LLVAAAIEHLDEQDELWQLLEERIAVLQQTTTTPNPGGDADPSVDSD
jgi:hypothetical protein